jgi:hypothetical protein
MVVFGCLQLCLVVSPVHSPCAPCVLCLRRHSERLDPCFSAFGFRPSDFGLHPFLRCLPLNSCRFVSIRGCSLPFLQLCLRILAFGFRPSPASSCPRLAPVKFVWIRVHSWLLLCPSDFGLLASDFPCLFIFGVLKSLGEFRSEACLNFRSLDFGVFLTAFFA